MVIQLLAQMLPLIVFIIVDAIYNKIKISIFAAIACAAVLLMLIYLITGAIDWFIFLDIGLIAGLGVIAILLKNEMFFKVKPAIIDVTVLIFIFTLFFSSDRSLLDYFGKLMPEGWVIDPTKIGRVRNFLLIMSVYVAAHIGAVLYTAKFSSRKMWAFIAGPGQFFIFIPVMIYVLVKRMKGKSLRA